MRIVSFDGMYQGIAFDVGLLTAGTVLRVLKVHTWHITLAGPIALVRSQAFTSLVWRAVLWCFPGLVEIPLSVSFPLTLMMQLFTQQMGFHKAERGFQRFVYALTGWTSVVLFCWLLLAWALPSLGQNRVMLFGCVLLILGIVLHGAKDMEDVAGQGQEWAWPLFVTLLAIAYTWPSVATTLVPCLVVAGAALVFVRSLRSPFFAQLLQAPEKLEN